MTLTEAIWAAGAMLAALLLLLAYLVALKAAANRREHRKQLWLHRLAEDNSAFERYLSGGDRESRTMVPRRALDLQVFEEYLLHRLKLNQTAAEAERVRDYAERYLSGYCRSRLRHRRKSERLNAMLAVESFRLSSLIPEVARFLDGGEPEERHLAFRVLARLQYGPAAERLAENRPPLPVFVIRQVLQVLDAGVLEQLMDRLETLPAEVQANLIDAVRIRNLRTEGLLHRLEELLESGQAELRIRALKAVANFGYMTDAAVERFLRRLAEEPPEQWQERLMAVRLMGSLRDERFAGRLEQLMGDPVYLVRIEAAKSLGMLRGGRDRLVRIAAEHPDRYAREMAQERLVAGG
ncbi:HEAT repeat domain-containing protein [Gorillibacterium sp. sgz5001074]|uniref:HEAT repeat domain-containing protein n=1 Tax=Gorillibacterium sp. sgz5001074 TaxID=3446695 RepID=UPI003F6794CF